MNDATVAADDASLLIVLVETNPAFWDGAAAGEPPQPTAPCLHTPPLSRRLPRPPFYSPRHPRARRLLQHASTRAQALHGPMGAQWGRHVL